MTETTYYTPTKLDEFRLDTLIEINQPEFIPVKGKTWEQCGYEDRWTQEYISSKILSMLEDWYYDRDRYGDIDLTKRVRIKQTQ